MVLGRFTPEEFAQIRDDITALVLEVMVRQMKMGMSSTVRDRSCLYRTVLGWVSDPGADAPTTIAASTISGAGGRSLRTSSTFVASATTAAPVASAATSGSPWIGRPCHTACCQRTPLPTGPVATAMEPGFASCAPVFAPVPPAGASAPARALPAQPSHAATYAARSPRSVP